MAQDRFILAIDQGTTSTRAVLFDASGVPVRQSQREITQIFPKDGWVEHDAEEIRDRTIAVCREVLKGPEQSRVASIGLTNQRETTVLWNRHTGKPVHNAIVWQDRRTADECERLRQRGLGPAIQGKTGLLLDPYFSATKLAWLLDNTPGAREEAERGDLCFGTIDSWLVRTLTDGRSHVTDISNAARTLLFNIHDRQWDDELLEWFNIPRSVLPEVQDSCAPFGETPPDLFGEAITIGGMAGDQQAAAFGQTCFAPGMIKSTYGTGCFLLMNTGDRPVSSSGGLITTIAYQLDGKPTYAIEGSIFMAGAIVQWLRDELRLVNDAAETMPLAAEANPSSKVVMVPAFVGLGAPYWSPHARGALLGMTRDTGRAEIVRAALEAVSFQTRDLYELMSAGMKQAGLKTPETIRVDGGMAANDWLCQNLADITRRQIDRPAVIETTALGAAFLAGLQCGLFKDMADLEEKWRCRKSWHPVMPVDEQETRYTRWQEAVERILPRHP